jgi:hypothetical protein
MLSDDRYRKECIFFHEGATLTMHDFFFYMVLPLHLKQTFLPIKEKMDALNSNIAPCGGARLPCIFCTASQSAYCLAKSGL